VCVCVCVSDFDGERWVRESAKVGYLAQEPKLDESKNVLGNVLEGVADKLEWIERHTQLAALVAEGKASEAEQLEVQELKQRLDSMKLWGLDKRVFKAMRALRCPPANASVQNLSGGEKRFVSMLLLI
jgi:sulfate-transporting ATPase